VWLSLGVIVNVDVPSCSVTLIVEVCQRKRLGFHAKVQCDA
jgi:hypothetical protein